MRISARGKFRTLVHDDGQPVTASIDTTLVGDPALRNGKMYIRVPVKDPIFHQVDVEIRRAQPDMTFTPLAQNKLFVKFSVSSHLIDPSLRSGDPVHLDLRLGTFGPFGYCWIASAAYKLDTTAKP
jgi:hypothetical protein